MPTICLVADSIEGLIYAEAQRGLALQPVLLNELRARTGILLALITASTAFLGALVIDNDKFGSGGIAAFGSFAAAIFCCLMVLSPRRKWEFTAGVAMLVQKYCDGKPAAVDAWIVATVERFEMERSIDQAISNMKAIQRWYLAAGGFVSVKTPVGS
jgi:hypothetical protein